MSPAADGAPQEHPILTDLAHQGDWGAQQSGGEAREPVDAFLRGAFEQAGRGHRVMGKAGG